MQAFDLSIVPGIPIDFVLFALTLLGVALFHRHTLQVALVGLAAITSYKLAFTGFKFGSGLPGLIGHMRGSFQVLRPCRLLSMELVDGVINAVRLLLYLSDVRPIAANPEPEPTSSR